MKIRIRTIRVCAAVLAGLVLVSLCAVAGAAGVDEKFVSRDAELDGVKIHYLINSEFVSTKPETRGGHGPAVLLLHGYAETSRMWTPLFFRGWRISFTVIAPDLPGNRGLVDSRRWIGYEDGSDTDSCAGEIVGR